jgi:hypothetical protein
MDMLDLVSFLTLRSPFHLLLLQNFVLFLELLWPMSPFPQLEQLIVGFTCGMASVFNIFRIMEPSQPKHRTNSPSQRNKAARLTKDVRL